MFCGVVSCLQRHQDSIREAVRRAMTETVAGFDGGQVRQQIFQIIFGFVCNGFELIVIVEHFFPKCAH